VSIDDGSTTAAASAFYVVTAVRCRRCGAELGYEFGFEGLTIPARSQVQINAAIHLGQRAPEWPDVIGG
jgi:hypothetical protein